MSDGATAAATMAGKVAVVTGAARGLGEAYARRLADRGAAVAVADLDAGAAEQVAAAIRSAGGTAEAFAVDVADEQRVRALVDEVVARLGALDVLVNNAGGVFAPWGPMEDVSLDGWSRTLAVNLTGTWLCTRAVVPHMKRAGGGKVVNVSTSMLSQATPVGSAAYLAAKGGVVGLTRALAKELGPAGITVNAIAPGLVPMDKAAGDPAKAAILERITQAVVAAQGIPRVGVADDLCGAVEFLASSASDFVTGQVLNVDGGFALV